MAKLKERQIQRKNKDAQLQPELAEHHGSQQAEPHHDGLAEKEDKAPVEDSIVKKNVCDKPCTTNLWLHGQATSS